jgi:hypothetical protein
MNTGQRYTLPLRSFASACYSLGDLTSFPGTLHLTLCLLLPVSRLVGGLCAHGRQYPREESEQLVKRLKVRGLARHHCPAGCLVREQ